MLIVVQNGGVGRPGIGIDIDIASCAFGLKFLHLVLTGLDWRNFEGSYNEQVRIQCREFFFFFAKGSPQIVCILQGFPPPS